MSERKPSDRIKEAIEKYRRILTAVFPEQIADAALVKAAIESVADILDEQDRRIQLLEWLTLPHAEDRCRKCNKPATRLFATKQYGNVFYQSRCNECPGEGFLIPTAPESPEIPDAQKET